MDDRRSRVMEQGNPYPCPKCGRPGGVVTIDKQPTLCESCEVIHVLSVKPTAPTGS